jgi:hypothetical protein
MRLTDLTPWARRAITPEVRLVIEGCEPQDIDVTLGKGASGWTCRLLREATMLNGAYYVVIGEAYGAPTVARAYSMALTDMESREEDGQVDEDDEWTNREGMPEFNGAFR